MKTKGRRQSKNVERGKDVDEGIKYALDKFGEKATNAAYPQKGSIAKNQLREASDLVEGRRRYKSLTGKDLDAALEGAHKRDKSKAPTGPRFPKRSRNPFDKARSK